MSSASTTPTPHGGHSPAGTRPVADRLARLRASADPDPDRSRAEVWAWLHELQSPRQRHRLAELFARGTEPEGPTGDGEGIVLELHGTPWLTGLDLLVRLGRRLGGMGWTGKSFDQERGTGYNRLTTSTRVPALLVMPRYRFTTIRGELTGFAFHHRIERSPLPPHPRVRAITYDAPEHRNPLVLPRTRDELVQLIPGTYLGRALLRTGDDWRVVGYFALRQPRVED